MNGRTVDLRSDTVTRPTPEMREVMMAAEVGDDVYAEDPTVNKLELVAAEMLGFDEALFFPTGSMANQTAIKLHTQPGQEVICEEMGHIFNFEMATMCVFSGVLPRPVHGEDGFLTARQVQENIRPSEYYRAQTGLVSLENTHNLRGGRIHDRKQVEEIIELCHRRGLPVHLDGARIFNAAVSTGSSAAELVAGCDTVMFCLSKGLGAPVGSILCGGNEVMERARSVRKMFGGGMRQIGMLAAAGIYALEYNLDKLADDHSRALRLARALASLPFVTIDVDSVQTNILVFELDASVIDAHAFTSTLKEHGILSGVFSDRVVRMVTHLDVDDDDIDYVADVLKRKFSETSV